MTDTSGAAGCGGAAGCCAAPQNGEGRLGALTLGLAGGGATVRRQLPPRDANRRVACCEAGRRGGFRHARHCMQASAAGGEHARVGRQRDKRLKHHLSQRRWSRSASVRLGGASAAAGGPGAKGAPEPQAAGPQAGKQAGKRPWWNSRRCVRCCCSSAPPLLDSNESSAQQASGSHGRRRRHARSTTRD